MYRFVFVLSPANFKEKHKKILLINALSNQKRTCKDIQTLKYRYTVSHFEVKSIKLAFIYLGKQCIVSVLEKKGYIYLPKSFPTKPRCSLNSRLP